MKVILLQEIRGVGKKYEIKDISDGYVRNFLIPKKLAEIATKKTISIFEKRRKEEFLEIKKREEVLENDLNNLKGMEILMKEKASEKGHLFAAIHQKEISDFVLKEKGIKIPSEMIEIEVPIKSTGKHEIKIRGVKIILKIINV